MIYINHLFKCIILRDRDMYHDLKIDAWDESEDRDHLILDLETLPEDLYGLLRRFTRIPNYEDVLRFITAYELLPVDGLSGVPFWLCKGPSGSGKSTLGEVLQKLNPCSLGDFTYLQSSDTAKGWEQSIPAYRKNHKGEEKSFPLVFIDDLTPSTFTGMGGDLKLALLKQVVNSNGKIRRGGVDGEPLSIDVFCKLITGSIHDITSIEGLQELERRCIVVEHKNINLWTTEHTEYTLSNEIENHNEFTFDPEYDEKRHMWFNAHRTKIRKDRKDCKAFLKQSDLIPTNRRDFYAPIIAMAVSCGFYNSVEDAALSFKKAFLNRVQERTETALQSLVREWIHGESSTYLKRISLYEKSPEEFKEQFELEIPYSDVAVFLRLLIKNMEITSRECKRMEVVAAMGLAGFKVVMKGIETIFIYKGV